MSEPTRCRRCFFPLEKEEIEENGDICEGCDFAEWTERDDAKEREGEKK